MYNNNFYNENGTATKKKSLKDSIRTGQGCHSLDKGGGWGGSVVMFPSTMGLHPDNFHSSIKPKKNLLFFLTNLIFYTIYEVKQSLTNYTTRSLLLSTCFEWSHAHII